MEILEGQLLGGRYKVVGKLSDGEAITYRARDRLRPGQPTCVVKHLRPASSTDPNLSPSERHELWSTAERLFDQEAKILERLGKHDQIPKLFDKFVENTEFFLVQEFINGRPLSSELTLGRQWSESQMLQILQEVLEVLGFVHCNGVTHGDIKPDNIIRRREDEQLVLVDFGGVKQVRASQFLTEQRPIKSTLPIGTVGYMACEQQQGQPVFSSDVYSLGIICIQALTGLSAMELQLQHSDLVTGELKWRHLASVSDELANVLTKMVCYRAKDRYQSATEVLQALERLNNDYPSVPPQYSKENPYLPVSQLPAVDYAGFWLRLIASWIDGVILSIPWLVTVFACMWLFYDPSRDEEANPIFYGIAFLVANFVFFLPSWLYYAIMESSPTRATVGKMVLGIVVTNLEGNKISFSQATGRHFAKIISVIMLYRGYLMAAFTDKKQALHDIMAGCLVVKKW
ncbi:MAG TPA: RDD family protein [Chroococcales cyanobacterium]|jgi:serine/threonine-protein kinase